MRITQGMTDRTYLKHNNSMQASMLKSETRIMTQKQFLRASEDSINASKALTVRRQLRNLDMYDGNISTSKEFFAAAESNLYTVANTIYLNVQNKLETACNGTYNEDDLDIFANELEQYAELTMETLNGDFAERQIFGGTNNSAVPFTRQSVEIALPEDVLLESDYILPTSITAQSDFTVAADFTAREDFILPTDVTAQSDYTLPSDTTLQTDITTTVDISDADGEIIYAAGDTIPTGTVIPKGTVIKEGGIIPKGTQISAGDKIPAGTVIAAGEDIPAGATLSAGETVPAGTVIFPSAGSADKVICYNGLPVDISADNPAFAILGNGTYTVKYTDGDEVTEKEYTLNFEDARSLGKGASLFPGSDPIYVDIGIGIKYDANYNVDPQTALDISLNGAEITGYGSETDAEGNKTYSNNYIQMIFDAAEALRQGDRVTANATLDRLNTANTGVLTQITTLGSKQNSMDFYLSKNEDYRYSLKERQNDVEGCDMNEEITDWKATDSAYNAILQMSSSVLPQSIFDFI